MRAPREAFVIGSGPNGLTAAIVLAKAGIRTTLLEAHSMVGGGMRSAELTLPGFWHDVCSAIHPMGLSSPAFSSFPLAEHGLSWIDPPLPVAHPFDDGSAAVLERSLEGTAARLGEDGRAYASTVRPWVERWAQLTREILRPLMHWPSHPFLLARFGMAALAPAASAARRRFTSETARALFAGLAGHSVLPLEALGSASFGWVLAVAAHAAGWPLPRGGSQRIADALASYFTSLGGTIRTGTRVRSIDEFDSNALVMCDITPRQFAEMAGSRLPSGFQRQLRRYRYGPGVFKLDWALSDPIPWKARECAQAGTIHVGGRLDEIAASERAAWRGSTSERPFLILTQSSLFDGLRAPSGKHTAWAYCHVPNDSAIDMTAHMENQIERFAPGFRDCILARHVFSPKTIEEHNENLVGGDITGGAQNLMQLLFRPTRMLYRTPLDNVYLCSSSTPPGGGVHGMCGYNAAQTALADCR